MSGTVGFLIAVGAVSLIIYWLFGRAHRIRDQRRALADGNTDTGGISSGSDAILSSWFGSRAWSSDNSCTASDSSSSWSDSSSCSDSGGGGGDGGGGGGGGD